MERQQKRGVVDPKTDMQTNRAGLPSPLAPPKSFASVAFQAPKIWKWCLALASLWPLGAAKWSRK